MPDMCVQPKCVLLVDDNAANLYLLQDSLEPLGHRLLCAGTGEAAIRLFDEHRPALVLLDLMMPGIDGIEALTRIRKSHPDSQVPIVLITAHSERVHRLRALEAGADDVMEKPIDVELLLARVDRLLKLHDTREHLLGERDSHALRAKTLELKQSSQRELIQFVVHDIKNQLHVVLADLDWAGENLRSSDTTALAEVIEEGSAGATRMRHMVEELLTYANLEDANFRVRLEPVAVDSMLGDVIGTYRRTAGGKRLSLSGVTASPCMLSADPQLLRRVFENLIDNSMHHIAPGGNVQIDLRVERTVRITVSNDGRTIPTAERERIFEKFTRGDGGATTRGSAGLGLYFCRRAIEAHRGRIQVEDRPGWTTSFVIELPAQTQPHSTMAHCY